MSKLMKIFLVLCMFFGLIQFNNVEANANDGKLTSYQINDFKSEVSIDSEIYPPIFEDISFTLSEELSDFNIELYYKLDDGSTYSFYADDHLYVDPQLKWKSKNLEFLYLMLSWWDDNGYYQEYYSKYDAETLSQYTYIDESSKVYYSDMDYSFSINNAQIDTVAPEIKDYKVVQNGDTLEFTFDIVEEASGIDYIEIYASEDIYFFISGSSLKGNSPYKVTREIGHYGINMDYGTYRVYGPQVYDKAGNRSEYDASYQFELKEEYNILESLTEEDIFVATNYMDGKFYFRKDETLGWYCNSVYLAYLDEEGNEERLGDSVTVEMNEIDFTQENPTYKTTLSYRINSKTEKTVEVEVDVILVDERIGTVLNANNVQELAFNYEKFINGEYDFSFVSGIVPAYVKLDSGEVILEMLKPGGFGEAPGIDGEGVHYIDTGGSGYYYPYYRTEKGEDNGVIATTFHIYLIDNDGNIRDQEGNILLEYSDRRSAKYHSLNDNVSMSWLEGTLPSYTEILVEDVSNEVELDGNNVAYDITLMADYQEVQPVGDVDVTVQLPENLQGKELDVYYIDDEGNQELIEETSFTDKEVTFTTDHFSTYAVVEKTCKHTTTKVENKKKANCTEKGYTGDKVCESCKQVIEKGKEVEATGHNYKDLVVKPSCTEKGYTLHECTCGDSYKDTEVAALGHNHVLDETTVKEATCTVDGYTGDKKCTCGDIIKGDVVKATDHTYVNGECACGDKEETTKPEVQPDTPKTSDTSNIMFFTFLMLLSAVVLVVLKKKELSK